MVKNKDLKEAKGKEYSELVRTYQVTFCSHSVFNNQVDFVSRFAMRTENGILLSDQIKRIKDREQRRIYHEPLLRYFIL